MPFFSRFNAGSSVEAKSGVKIGWVVPVGTADPVAQLLRSPPVKSSIKQVKEFVQNATFGVFPIADPSHSTKIKNILKKAFRLIFLMWERDCIAAASWAPSLSCLIS